MTNSTKRFKKISTLPFKRNFRGARLHGRRLGDIDLLILLDKLWGYVSFVKITNPEISDLIDRFLQRKSEYEKNKNPNIDDELEDWDE